MYGNTFHQQTLLTYRFHRHTDRYFTNTTTTLVATRIRAPLKTIYEDKIVCIRDEIKKADPFRLGTENSPSACFIMKMHVPRNTFTAVHFPI